MKVCQQSWLQFLPISLVGSDVEEAETFAEAKHLAQIQLDLIAEDQDGTEEYTQQDISQIRQFTRRK